jgi:PAS domain S-box-containing protein
MLIAAKNECEQLKAAMNAEPASPNQTTMEGDDPYVLFKSFIDDSRDCLVLIDTSYRICYMNRSAARLLHINKTETAYGRNIFDLMTLKDALKLKEKIDRAYLRGKKEKVKDLRLIKYHGDGVKVKASVVRVQYNGLPAVRLKIKSK